jgi:hypothetical protein
MFEVGTKVILLSSSHNGSTGPKRGSVGYFSCIQNNGAVFTDTNVGSIDIEVFFTRYGYEQKTRCERKVITVLFPIIIAPEECENINEKVVALCKGVMPLHKRFRSSSATTVAFASQIPHCVRPITASEPEDIEAWIRSLVYSHEIRDFLSSILAERRFDNFKVYPLSSHGVLDILQGMYFDHSYLESVIGRIRKNSTDSYCEMIIDAMRIITVLIRQKYLKRNWPTICQNIMELGGSTYVYKVASHLLPFIFTPLIKSMPIEEWPIEDHVRQAIRCVESTKQLFLGLSGPAYNGCNVLA